VSPLIIPIAIEWVIMVTSAAPILLLGRFERIPRFGLRVWFAALLSSGLATVLAVGIAVASIFDTYLKLSAAHLGSSGWLATLGVSFAPWLILAISGIALAITNHRLEPILANAREVGPLLATAARPWRSFHGHQVKLIELPIFVAGVVSGTILVSTAAERALTSEELDAVLWHEVGHLRGRHNQLKRLAGFVQTLSPWLVASQALVNEVHRLAELDADQFATKYVNPDLLKATRSKFLAA
jgi:Zn-dependent protease with chaperone function